MVFIRFLLLYVCASEAVISVHRMLMKAGYQSWYSLKENPGLDYSSGFL